MKDSCICLLCLLASVPSLHLLMGRKAVLPFLQFVKVDKIIRQSCLHHSWVARLQIVDHYRKHLPAISKSETTFKVAFIERHHKRRIENYQELLDWCNNRLVLPPGSQFTEIDCVPLNLDKADRYLQTLAEMQTVDILVR